MDGWFAKTHSDCDVQIHKAESMKAGRGKGEGEGKGVQPFNRKSKRLPPPRILALMHRLHRGLTQAIQL